MGGARQRLGRDQRGGITVLLASSLFILAGAGTVAVDLGSIYLAKRALQGVADAAALAANGGGNAAAQALIDRSPMTGVTVGAIESGFYARDQTVAIDQRFQPGDPRGGATRIVVQQQVPLFFGRLLVGKSAVAISATATAARTDMAAFSLGTGLASLSGGVPNALLSALAGTELNLTVMDYHGLANAQVDLLGFADALRISLARQGQSHAEIFGSDIPASDILDALADSVADAQTASKLRDIGNRMTGRSIRLDKIIDLGPLGQTDIVDDRQSLAVDAFTLLRMILSPPPDQASAIDLRLDVAGLAGSRLILATGGGVAYSPLLTVTADHDVVIRTAQTRLYLETTVASALGGLASVRLPLFVELAAAEARLSDINCTAGTPGHGVTLAVTPSIGSVALGDIDTNLMTSFQTPVTSRPAQLGQTLVARISGHAQIALGGTQPQSVHFTPEDVQFQRARTVQTGDLVQGIAGSLTRGLQVQVTVLGITTSTGPLSQAVGALLGTTAPLVDGLLNSVTGVMGVRLGTADVRVHQMRCGQSTLVA
ncbi:pilus assembly protein TadG-related protein [Sphingobium sp. AN641]|uniref:pilus assembly protein TadG-related protein n=1 Tax=Sphingobium sp. AN641 TaxID=3133443 RepID=UPI0030C110DB